MLPTNLLKMSSKKSKCSHRTSNPIRTLDMVRVFITDLDFMVVMHRFLICFTEAGAEEGENRFNAAEILFFDCRRGMAHRCGGGH